MGEPRLPGLQGQGSELARLMLAQLFLNACVTGARMEAPLQAHGPLHSTRCGAP